MRRFLVRLWRSETRAIAMSALSEKVREEDVSLYVSERFAVEFEAIEEVLHPMSQLFAVHAESFIEFRCLIFSQASSWGSVGHCKDKSSWDVFELSQRASDLKHLPFVVEICSLLLCRTCSSPFTLPSSCEWSVMKIELRIRGLSCFTFVQALCPLTCVWYLVHMVGFAGRSRGSFWLVTPPCSARVSSPSGRLDDVQLPPPAHGLAFVFGHLSASRCAHPLLTRKSHPIQCSGCGVNRTKKTHTERSVASRFFVLPSCGETNRVAGLGSWWRPPVSELTCCVHIIFLKEKTVENVFQMCSRGSSGLLRWCSRNRGVPGGSRSVLLGISHGISCDQILARVRNLHVVLSELSCKDVLCQLSHAYATSAAHGDRDLDTRKARQQSTFLHATPAIQLGRVRSSWRATFRANHLWWRRRTQNENRCKLHHDVQSCSQENGHQLVPRERENIVKQRINLDKDTRHLPK